MGVRVHGLGCSEGRDLGLRVPGKTLNHGVSTTTAMQRVFEFGQLRHEVSSSGLVFDEGLIRVSGLRFRGLRLRMKIRQIRSIRATASILDL